MSLTRDEILAGPQSIPSDPHVVADFCLIPFPTTAEPTVSVSPYIAIVQQTLDKAKKEGRIEGYLMHSYGTNLEGTWDNVMTVLKECHLAVHKRGNIWRVATEWVF